jgi:hypothetical protein
VPKAIIEIHITRLEKANRGFLPNLSTMKTATKVAITCKINKDI